jgi:hypothetical protein
MSRTQVLPSIDVGFATGTRVPKEDTPSPQVARLSGDVSLARYWHRGDGAARRYTSVGGALVLGWEDSMGADVGMEIIFAPPRADRHAGFQFRAGPRLHLQDRDLSTTFAAEWAHWLIGSLYAELAHDLRRTETTFLFGVRINLLLPYALITVDTIPID